MGKKILGVVVAVALAIATGFAVKEISSNDDKSETKVLRGSSSNPYSFTYPNNWKPLSEDKLKKLSSKPLAVVTREDRKGTVTLYRRAEIKLPLNKLIPDLRKALKKQVSDFQEIKARVVKIPAGQALFYTYIRKKHDTAHSILVVPAGKLSYTLNFVARSGDRKLGTEIAEIVRSFDVNSQS